MGGIGEVEDERVGREIPLRVAESWRNRKKLHHIAKYFATEKGQRSRS